MFEPYKLSPLCFMIMDADLNDQHPLKDNDINIKGIK